MKKCILVMLILSTTLTLSNCGSGGGGSYSQSRVTLINGRAVAPYNAPIAVKRAVAAGNALQRKPYRMGGGHARHNDSGYDCSGTVSYVLRNAGLMNSTMPSTGFRSYGRRGKGRWITVYARRGHVFMTIGGLRLDARGYSRGYMGGPRWLVKPRSSRGFSVRHPRGL
jgi:hypothetical protein